MRKMTRFLGWTVGLLAIAFAVLGLGALVHEAGHALVALAFGAHVEQLNVLGLDLYPIPRIHYRPGYFGYVRFDRRLPSPQVHYMAAAGSLSTLLIALLAQGVLWARPPRRAWPRLVVIGFCFSWIDIVYHTLPVMVSWLPVFGPRRASGAEAYQALIALGAPGGVVGAMTVGGSVVLLLLTLIRWWQLARLRRL